MKKEFDSWEQDKLELEGNLKENSKIILQLNSKVEELKNQKSESGQTAVKYDERIKSMNDEVEKLNCEKLEAEHTVEVYKKKFEDPNAVKHEEKIKFLNDEVKKLKCEKLQADQTVEVYTSYTLLQYQHAFSHI
ncbi:Hypothetical predicted protein [Olea europaea subsp. europaea]|uniref:Uncharacterized protein n=1 Tax=Olea europaea subsp. europaea TaxID=158383 RepID=A0A8S0Q661_OLEEU|nr:Hypothetical predicted protein [Olea europaea subsp. europaea]